jgi:hypothetical protein
VISPLASLMAATIVAVSPVDVRSATNCPSTEDVVARLLPLLPAAAGPAEGQDVAQIEVGAVQAGGAMELHLLLLRPDASVVGDRRLLMQGTCQDMAEAVATVIAAWETKPLPGAAPDEVPVPTAKVVATLAQVPGRPLQIFVGASAGAALVGGIAATGGLDLLLGRSASHWQLRLGLAGETTRQVDLLGGHVGWRHTTAVLGVCWHVLDPSWLLSLDAGPTAGWATLVGSGFSADRQQRSFEYGVAAGLRAGRSFGRLAVWAEWRTNLWAQAQRATLTGDPAGADLPQVDTAVGLGISALLFQ